MIMLDFETRCTVPIKAGASRYSLNAEIMCLSYSIDGGPVKSWAPGEPAPIDLFKAISRGDFLHAHNAAFEQAIWRNVMVAKFGWPAVDDTKWVCTQAECLSVAIPPSLENSAEALELRIKKDMTGRRLMQRMSKPRKPTKNDKSPWHEKPEQMAALRAYCDQDVLAEAAVHDAIPRLSSRELSVYHFDQRVNRRGVMIDRELVEAVVDVWAQYTRKLNSELRDITFGLVDSADAVKVLTELLPKIGAPVANLTKNSVADALKMDLPPTARRILEIRAELAMSSVSKFDKMLLCIEPDDRIRGCFQYHGAGQTGRWAGRMVQLQNLPRGLLKAEQIDPMVELLKTHDLDRVLAEGVLPIGKLLSSLVRSAIIAPTGKRLIVCDFASVEARGLAWAAGEEWLLEAFRDGKDAYKEMAGAIYERPASEITKDQRFMGKQAVLGCGYSMGAAKFQASLEGTYGVVVSVDFCQTIVDAYRAKNKMIKAFWYKVERAAVNAVRGVPSVAGPYQFYVKDKWLRAVLPSGREISYYKPVLRPGKYGDQINFYTVGVNGKIQPSSTYSGKLVENLTQALCRDLLVEAMAKLEKAGYTTVAHIHDEVVLEVDNDFGSVAEVERIMEIVPDWAKGFPIGAEGFECTRYRK